MTGVLSKRFERVSIARPIHVQLMRNEFAIFAGVVFVLSDYIKILTAFDPIRVERFAGCTRR